MCTGKPANPRGLVTLYCWGRSFHSTAEAWDWTCTVSEVLLYSPVLIIKMQETSMNSLNKTLMITSKYVVSASFFTLKKKKKITECLLYHWEKPPEEQGPCMCSYSQNMAESHVELKEVLNMRDAKVSTVLARRSSCTGAEEQLLSNNQFTTWLH